MKAAIQTDAPDPARLVGRTLSDDERRAFLAAKEAALTAQLRRLRDEAAREPALMATYGFAAAKHPPTVGLMAYRDDEVRRQHWIEIRREIAERAMGLRIGVTP